MPGLRSAVRSGSALCAAGLVGAAGVVFVPAEAHAATPNPTPTPTRPPTGGKDAAAVSDASSSSDSSSSGSSSSSSDSSSSDSSTSSTSSSSTAAPTPDYGFQKVRLGVRLADGSVVPPGTKTSGSVLSYTLSSLNTDSAASSSLSAGQAARLRRAEAARDAADASGTPCTTQASTIVAGSSASFCTFTAEQNDGESLADPTELILYPQQTITVTQTSAVTGLVLDRRTVTAGPACPSSDTGDVSGVFCRPDSEVGQDLSLSVTDLIFEDPGLPPIAKPDQAIVQGGSSVLVDVLANDDAESAPATIGGVGEPGHGTAAIVGSDGQQIRYTPAPGFVGTDSFSYTIRTGNGTDTGEVSVTVTAPPAATPTAPTTKDTVTLPFTGFDTESVLPVAAALLLGGAAIQRGLSRRRRR